MSRVQQTISSSNPATFSQIHNRVDSDGSLEDKITKLTEHQDYSPEPLDGQCPLDHEGGSDEILDHDEMTLRLKADMRRLLGSVQSSGDFCAGGVIRLPNPGLIIDGLGLIAMPLIHSQADAIKAVASLAPYGKGPHTLVDKSVRNAFQIEASRVSMTNTEWNPALKVLVNLVAKRLGTDAEYVDASLYKLFLYEREGHFKPHKDSEKEPGMFGTLVVQFPSEFTGGEFIVRHCGVERTFDFSLSKIHSIFEFSYTAHFADCEHEIKPITSGVRFVAVYSLCWKGNGPPPNPPTIAKSMELAQHLVNLDRCFGWILDHQYTPASLERFGCSALKGRDRAIADCILTANDMIQQEDPKNELIVLIIMAERIDNDWGSGDLQIGEPRLNLLNGVHTADGMSFQVRFTPNPSYTAALGSLRFYEDIINEILHDDDEDVTSNDDDAEDEWAAISRNDDFWRNCLGRGVAYVGNEGGEGEKLYSCYVLCIMRRACLDSLSFEGCPKAAVQAVHNSIEMHGIDLAKVELLRLMNTGNHAIAACAQVLDLIAALRADDIFVDIVSRMDLTVITGPGGVDYVVGFPDSAAVTAFASASELFGRDVFNRLSMNKVEADSKSMNPDKMGKCAFVVDLEEENSNRFRIYSSLEQLWDSELNFSWQSKSDVKKKGNVADRLMQLSPLLISPHGRLRIHEFAHVLRGCADQGCVDNTVVLLSFLAKSAGTDTWELDWKPNNQVAESIAYAVKCHGWSVLAESVLHILRASLSASGPEKSSIYGLNCILCCSRLWLICSLLPYARMDPELVGHFLRAYLDEVHMGNLPCMYRKKPDEMYSSATFLLLIEYSSTDLRNYAMSKATKWERYSDLGKLALAIARNDEAALSKTWLKGASMSRAACSFACEIASVILSSEKERLQTRMVQTRNESKCKRMLCQIKREINEVEEFLREVEATAISISESGESLSFSSSTLTADLSS